MRIWILATLLCVSVVATAQQTKNEVSLKSILLQQLRETHNEKNWFVSEKEAVAGLTAQQAAWSDGKNHSVGQLLRHLNFWNAQSLARMKNQPTEKVADNNDTFQYEPKQWDESLKQFDVIMSDLEQQVQSADDATLAKFAPMIARVAQHNAYHLAEMVTSRKAQGSWNPENGVK